MTQGPFHTLLFSLPQLKRDEVGPTSRLPVRIGILFEWVLRNCDGRKITEKGVCTPADGGPTAARTEEIPRWCCAGFRRAHSESA